MILVLSLVVFGCSKSGDQTAPVQPHSSRGNLQATREAIDRTSLANVIHEIRAMRLPEGTKEETFVRLKVELERSLLARRLNKFPSRPPTSDPNNGITLVITPSNLSWEEVRWGDWNNDGIVSATDILPVALNFGSVGDPASSDYWLYAEYVDGDRDGTVNLGDISPIALHFGESTGGYNVYEADDANGTNAQKIASLPRPSPPPDPNNPPFGISLAPLQYSYPGPVTTYKYYRVVPFDTSLPPLESSDVASPWVQALPILKAPWAIARAYPYEGAVPLTVGFSAFGSNDPDGTILLYEWDFDGDGTWDYQDANSADTKFTYTTTGFHQAVLRVTDNDGLTGTGKVGIKTWEGSWYIETVDSEGDTGWYTSLAFDRSGRPAISYFDRTNIYLKFARWNGTIWVIEVVDPGDNVGSFTSLAFDASGNPAISYYDHKREWLKFARWDPGRAAWKIEDVSSGLGPAGRSLAFDPSGAPAISLGGSRLYLARRGADGWKTEVVDSNPDAGSYPSLVFDPSGNPAISYIEWTNVGIEAILKFARWNGTTWDIEVVDSGGNVGWHNSLAFDSSGNPAISYRDRENEDLKFARWNGTGWEIEVVDSEGDVGAYTSLVFLPSGNAAVSYFDITGLDLKVATWNGTDWIIETVDAEGHSGLFSSIAVGPNGHPAVSYWSAESLGGPGRLKFAQFK